MEFCITGLFSWHPTLMCLSVSEIVWVLCTHGGHLILVYGFHVGGNSVVFTDIIRDKGGWLLH